MVSYQVIDSVGKVSMTEIRDEGIKHKWQSSFTRSTSKPFNKNKCFFFFLQNQKYDKQEPYCTLHGRMHLVRLFRKLLNCLKIRFSWQDWIQPLHQTIHTLLVSDITIRSCVSYKSSDASGDFFSQCLSRKHCMCHPFWRIFCVLWHRQLKVHQ